MAKLPYDENEGFKKGRDVWFEMRRRDRGMIRPGTDRVLVTGAAGAIGSALRTGLRARWRKLRLTEKTSFVPVTEPLWIK